MEEKQVVYVNDDLEELEVESSEEKSKKIETKEDATRYAYGLSKTRDELAEIDEIAEKEIAKWKQKIEEVEKWREEVSTPLEDRCNYFEILLSTYHMEEFNNADEKAQNKLKSIKLPYGVTLKSRAQNPKYEVVDKKKYEEFAKENKLLKEPTPPAPDWSTIKKKLAVTEEGKTVFEDTGEVVDFISVTPQARKFEVN